MSFVCSFIGLVLYFYVVLSLYELLHGGQIEYMLFK